MKPSDFDIELEKLFNQSVGRLLSSDDFSGSAFSNLYEYLCTKAESIKEEHVVSKQVISYIFSAQRAIENSSCHNQEASKHLQLANDFSYLLELISRGETPNDRKPGVPRIY